MNKLKGLKEKRNDLVSKQKTMLSTAIDETRSLTEEEDTELRSVIEQIKELLGHSNLDTTMIYAIVDQEQVKYNHRKYAG